MDLENNLKLIIHGRIPSKKNSRITTRSGRTIPSKQYTKWHKDAEGQLAKQGAAAFPARAVSLCFYMPDARRKDLTNAAESILDLLVDCGVIADDCWQVISEVILKCHGIDRENPRCEIYLQGAN